MRGGAVCHAVAACSSVRALLSACSSLSCITVAVQVPGHLPMEDDLNEFDYDLQLSWFQEWESTPMPPLHRLGGLPAAVGCSQASHGGNTYFDKATAGSCPNDECLQTCGGSACRRLLFVSAA